MTTALYSPSMPNTFISVTEYPGSDDLVTIWAALSSLKSATTVDSSWGKSCTHLDISRDQLVFQPGSLPGNLVFPL